MVKFRSKLKGQSKGKRWAKGQSSSSNPESQKYRNLARSRFFQENLGPSNLTSDALRKHDAANTVYTVPKLPSVQQSSNIDEEIESLGTSFRTLQTFASDWSECSNVSFSRLLQVFRPDSALHKEMLAVLAAVTEVIKQNGGSETSTEYYAALMTTLEVAETDESLTAVLALLNMGLKSVPASVLKLQFASASKLFIDLLNKNAQAENNVILKSLFGILANLLRVQEYAVWNDASTMQIFASLLAFVCHSKPKIRRAAQQSVCLVLNGSSFMNNDDDSEIRPHYHPAAVRVAEFCIQQIEGCTGTAGQTTTLHTLTLLKDIIHTFPKAQIKSVCETILKIMTINNPLINSCGMQVLHSLFSAKTTTMPTLLNGQLISALYDYQPGRTDVQPTLAWMAVMQQAHVHLADVDVTVSCTALPKIVSTLSQLWLSERAEIINAVTHTLQVILEDCVAPVCGTSDTVQQSLVNLQKCFAVIESCLSYQYNKIWQQVLYIISIMFKVAGKHCSDLLIKCLKHLMELRDSYKFSYNNELENAVGAAIQSMGPDVVLQVITLKKNEDEINLDRSWLLPILKENIQNSSLEYFAKNIVPLAMMCHRKSVQLTSTNDGIGAHSYELLYTQLWNLLPSFCNNPQDVKEHFKHVAKILGSALAEKKELRLAVLTSLRKLIATAKENEDDGELHELGRFAKNYLPILFNFYTSKPNGTDEEGQRLAALETIKVYLSIAQSELTEQLFSNALERLKTTTTEPSDLYIKESLFDLIRVLVKYQDRKTIQLLYEQCIKNLRNDDSKNDKEQKKAYRLLEEICSSESDGCKQFINENRKLVQKLLTKSLASSAVSSRSARLHCLNYLVRIQPQLDHESKLLKAAVPEAVLCCKDINKKCRLAAYQLLTSVGETLQKRHQMTEYVTILISGLAGTANMISATILAFASVVHNFSGSLGMDNINRILETICQLMTATTRDIVSSSLCFVKVFITTLPSPLVAESLPLIMKSISNMSEDCKRNFRIKVRNILDRLIRKYGCETIAPHVPAADTVMHKRLKNLRKLNARKKKQKEESKRKQEEEEEEDVEEFAVRAKSKSIEDILADSDSDLDDFESDKPSVGNRKVINTWIQENEDNIVDFTDPSAVSKITTTKPGMNTSDKTALVRKTKKDRGFKTAPDGRLIIADDSNSDHDDDDVNTMIKNKNKIDLNSDSESEEDHRSAAETAILGNRKRKRSGAESVRSSQQPILKYKPGGSGIHRQVNSSGGGGGASEAGTEYKPKKAKGDVKKKGKLDPYAYLPLSRATLNKRKRMKNTGQFKNILKGAKKGAKVKKGNAKK